MNDFLSKSIKRYREFRGYSQEYMAYKMEISQASYSKIEGGGTRITIERLFHILKLLEVDFMELLGQNDIPLATQNKKDMRSVYQENEKLYVKLIETKDEEIALLKKLLSEK